MPDSSPHSEPGGMQPSRPQADPGSDFDLIRRVLASDGCDGLSSKQSDSADFALLRIEEQLEEMRERWLGMRDCYDREVLAGGRLKEQYQASQDALYALFEYVKELERMHGVAVAVRGGKYPDGAEKIGEQVRAALASYPAESHD